MKSRYLFTPIENLAFADRKMAFVSGPRQVGKTTLGKSLLKKRKSGSYHNWDDIEFRRLWTKNPKLLVLPPSPKKMSGLLMLDEIHKAKSWKRGLKGLFDTLDSPLDILVTGSARLNVFKKGGDSLLGRYVHFRLHPFTMREMSSSPPASPDGFHEAVLNRSLRARPVGREHLESLMRFGGFPEPLFAQNEKKARIWRRSRVEKVIREDLRDLSRIPELSRIEMLASLLPEKVGSSFSLSSLREDLEVAHDTARRWTLMLKELYYFFEIKPWSRSVNRSLKKEGKIYLWDAGEVTGEPARFENLVASHLLKACDFWTDTGEGLFELYYLRNKEKQEIDFLIVRDRKPWLPVEVKWRDRSPSPSWKKFLPALGVPFGVQLVSEAGHWEWRQAGDGKILIASAADFLMYLV